MPKYESLEKRVNVPRPRAKAAKHRYKGKALVDSGTRDRTISRYNRLKAKGINPGLSQRELDTGAGARRVKQLLADSRPILHTDPLPGKSGQAPGRKRGNPTPGTPRGGGVAAPALAASGGVAQVPPRRRRRRYRWGETEEMFRYS